MSGLRLAAVLATLVAGLGPARSQSADQQDHATTNQSWAAACTTMERAAPLDCSMEQRVINSRTGGLLARVQIRIPSDTRSPVMLVQLPLGVYLPAKLTMEVDGGYPETIEFQSCDQSGCYAGSPVSEALLAAMLVGQTLTLSVQNQSWVPASVPITLVGFAKAYGGIK